MRTLPLYIILLLLGAACTTRQQHEAMRSGLDSINRLNRAGQPFTVDGVQPFTDYFDRHGNSNDRLLAHYLMGRAYHEQGEAPMALECYHRAIECADTTHADCDFSQLSRVYAQMEDIFYQQNLYNEQLQCIKKAVNYAWMAKDNLGAIIEMEQMANAYDGMSVTDSVISILQQTAGLFSKYGYAADAAIVQGNLMVAFLKKHELERARESAAIYESESGVFDASGKIEEGRELYYYYKGMLCIEYGMVDSAECYFRKALSADDYNCKNSGSLGLAMLYESLNRPDSAMKYYKFSRMINDSMYTELQTYSVNRIESLYNYSRHKKMAFQAERRADTFRLRMEEALGILVVVICTGILFFKNLNSKRKMAEQSYIQSLKNIEMAQTDILLLRANENSLNDIISAKEQIIADQKAKLNKFNLSHSLAAAEVRLRESEKQPLIEMLMYQGRKPTEQEWHMLRMTVLDVFPGYYHFLISKQHMLSDNEFNTCLLIRLHFPPSTVCAMIEKSRPTITKMRIRLLKKLFDMDGQAHDFDQRILQMC